MDSIPLDFNKLIELYNSFELKDFEELTTENIINGLIYNNKILDEKSLSKLSKIKSLTYDNEELKKLIISQQIKNYLIQELLKVLLQDKDLQKENLTLTKSYTDLIKRVQQSYDGHIEYLNKQKDLYDKIEQIISYFKALKVKYNL